MKRLIYLQVELKEDDKNFVVEMLQSLSQLCLSEANKILAIGDNVKADERLYDSQRLLLFSQWIVEAWEEGTDVT